MKYLKLILVIYAIFLTMTPAAIARTGSDIETTANAYLNHQWICNTWNARIQNTSNNPNNPIPNDPNDNDINHPFYPAGARYRNAQNQVVTSTGIYPSVAYGWGIRETPGDFDYKLNALAPVNPRNASTYLVSSKKGEPNSTDLSGHPELYAGLDCSGLVIMSNNMPARNVSIWENRWHINSTMLAGIVDASLTEAIPWDSLKNGDILAKSGHVAIVTGFVQNTTEQVNVIEEAYKYNNNQYYHDPHLMRCMENTYTINRTSNIISRDNDPDGSRNYHSRRFPSPILKEVKIYRGNSLTGGGLFYHVRWDNVAGNYCERTRNILVRRTIPRLEPRYDAGEITIELVFNVNMAVAFYQGDNLSRELAQLEQELNVRIVNDYPNGWSCQAEPVTNIQNNWRNGWKIAPVNQLDNGFVSLKWLGRAVIPNTGSHELNDVTLRVLAKSLTQDWLDGNPATIARRSASGGWADYVTQKYINQNI